MRPVCLLLLFCLAACDSVAPPNVPVDPPVTPTPPPPAPPLRGFVLPEVPAILTYEAGDRTTLTPSSFFGNAGAPSDLTFTATSSGPSVTVQTTRVALTIGAVSEGAATVSVTFKAGGHRDTTFALPVVVVSPRCPAAAPAGARDYVPVQAGTVWTFGYTSLSYSTNRVETVDATLKLTFGQPACLRGRRTWPVEQRLSGTRQASSTSPSVPITGQASTTMTESETNEVAFNIELLSGLSHSASLGRYRVASGGGILGVTGTAGCMPPPGGAEQSMEFTLGIGLTRESLRCGTPTGELLRTLTRRT